MALYGLNCKNFCCVLQASVIVVRVVTTDSRNQLLLCGQLHMTECKDEGNKLKSYLPEDKQS